MADRDNGVRLPFISLVPSPPRPSQRAYEAAATAPVGPVSSRRWCWGRDADRLMLDAINTVKIRPHLGDDGRRVNRNEVPERSTAGFPVLPTAGARWRW
jgi:hypothetical protein